MEENTTQQGRQMRWFLVAYIPLFFWWLFMAKEGIEDTFQNYLFGLVFGLIPLAGGIVGLVNASRWQWMQSVMGRATTYLSLGLLAWSVGGLIWAYYNFFGAIDVPYPSLADAAYIVSWPMWTMGVITLSRASGAQFSLRKNSGKLLLLIIPLLVAILSYYLLIVVARGGEFVLSDGFLKAFFDLAYPIGDVIILTFSLLIYGLSFRYLGGQYKLPILLILLGFVVNYIADMVFSWNTTLGIFHVGGISDFFFMGAMTLLSAGLAGLSPLVLEDE